MYIHTYTHTYAYIQYNNNNNNNKHVYIYIYRERETYIERYIHTVSHHSSVDHVVDQVDDDYEVPHLG